MSESDKAHDVCLVLDWQTGRSADFSPEDIKYHTIICDTLKR